MENLEDTRPPPPRRLKRYLVDANVFVAAKEDGKARAFVEGHGTRHVLATTRAVMAEVEEQRARAFVPSGVHILEPGPPEPGLERLREDTATELKRASDADLSLAQALVEDSGFDGIASLDADLDRMSLPSYLRKYHDRSMTLLDAEAL